MLKVYFAASLCIPLLLILSFAQSMKKEQINTSCDDCLYWQSKVDQSIRLPENTPEKNEKDEKNIVAAISCLLKLKGKAAETKYSAIVSFKLVEAKLPTPTVEIAALYKISALYHQQWNHAEAIVLVDENRNMNKKESIESAYKAYEAWFEKVKKIGLQKAREDKLEPLADAGVSWY